MGIHQLNKACYRGSEVTEDSVSKVIKHRWEKDGATTTKFAFKDVKERTNAEKRYFDTMSNLFTNEPMFMGCITKLFKKLLYVKIKPTALAEQEDDFLTNPYYKCVYKYDELINLEVEKEDGEAPAGDQAMSNKRDQLIEIAALI